MPETIIQVPEIVVEINDVIDGDVTIAAVNYIDYPVWKFFEVEGWDSFKTESVAVQGGGASLLYSPNLDSHVWNYPDVSSETFVYRIKNATTDEIGEGKLTIRRVVDVDFVANDIYITLEDHVPDEILIHSEKYFDETLSIEFNGFVAKNMALVKNIRSDTPTSKDILVLFDKNAGWSTVLGKTSIDFNAYDVLTGDSSKARIIINSYLSPFYIKAIGLNLNGSVPSSTSVDVVSYNTHVTQIRITDAAFIQSAAGTVEIGTVEFDNEDYNGDFNNDFSTGSRNGLIITFNLESGYWDRRDYALVRYSMTTTAGRTATNYVFITK